jgi:hypothetical protein
MNYDEIKLEIDELKEYIETALCKKCEQMKEELEALERKLLEISKQQQ